MLCRDDDGVDVMRLAVDVAHGDLGFRVRTQPRQAAVFTKLGLALHQPMRKVDRQRHELRGLVAREAVHQALVARALLEIHAGAFVDALLDVLRLLIEGGQHCARAVVETHLGIVVADAFDDVACEVAVVDARAGRDLAGHDDETGRHERFRSDATVFVLREHRVDHGIGDCVCNFVGMSFGNGFRSE
jgi:hypothetical protein